MLMAVLAVEWGWAGLASEAGGGSATGARALVTIGVSGVSGLGVAALQRSGTPLPSWL